MSGQSAVSPAIRQAVALHAAGRLAEAEVGYQAVLRSRADDFDALHMLGVIRTQQARHDEAIRLIAAALRLKPRAAAAHVNLGNARQGSGDLDGAIASFRRARALQPDLVDAHCNLGSALAASGRFNDARAALEAALRLDPAHVQSLVNLGHVLGQLGRLEDAVAVYRRALAVQPAHAAAHYNLGTALAALGQREEAVAAYQSAVRLQPGFGLAHNNLGGEFLELNRLAEAQAALERAIACAPGLVDAHTNLGLALSRLRRPLEAIASFRRALAIDPRNVTTLKHLSVVLQRGAVLDEALHCLAQAAARDPSDGRTASMLLGLKRRMCDWHGLEEEVRRLCELVDRSAAPVLPFTLMTVVDDPHLHLRAARRFVDSAGYQRLKHLAVPRRYRHERARIAYLSSDYYEHATAYLMAELFELHDRDRFEIIGFSWGADDHSPMRRRLVEAFDQFYEVADLSDLEVARRMQAMEIDIAVDLKGFTDNCRPAIFASRPAPVQVDFIGYPGTTACPFIDYALVDRVVVPESSAGFFTETLVYLDPCYQPNDRKRTIAPAPSREACGLPQGAVVFACFSNSYKIGPESFSIWMELLHAVPGAVLWLLEDNRWARDNLRREAGSRGIEASRLVFAPRVPLAEHIARHQNADLCLDTWPYNAHTTASDALWAGVPIVTFAGKSFAARVAASLLGAVGLGELVAADAAGYKAIALDLARSPRALADIKQRLAAARKSAPLFDTPRFCRGLEAAYLTMLAALPEATSADASPP